MDTEILKKIAKLSKLRFNDADLSKFEEEFTNILKYMEQLKEVETEGIEPYMTPITEHLRNDNDSGKDTLDKNTALSLAAHHDENYYIVPKVGVK